MPTALFRAMGRPLASCALLWGILAAATPIAAAEQTETERVNQVFPLAPGGTLKLKNFSGDVRIVGADRSDVAINAVRRAPRERLERIKLDIQASAGLITIEANKKDRSWIRRLGGNNVVETDFDIEVPRKTDIDLSVFSSGVSITGVAGRHDVHGFSSSLRLRDVSGPIKAKTFSGDIDIDLAASEGRPELDVDSFSGDIVVRMPERAAASVSFSSFSGDLTSDLPLTLTTRSRRRLRADLNAGEGRSGEAGRPVTFKTFSGDVRIRK